MELSAGVPNQIYLIIQTVIIFFMAAESGIFASLRAGSERRKARADIRRKEDGAHV